MENYSLSYIAIIVILLFSSFAIASLDGNGTQASPWQIKSIEDFNEFASDSNYWDDYTRLQTDINLTGHTYTSAIIAYDSNTYGGFTGTAFTGSFDGNDHTISNFTCEDVNTRYAGIFGKVSGTNCCIENLTVTDVNISLTGHNSTTAGAIAGSFSTGALTNCKVINANINAGPDSHDVGSLIGSVNGGYALIENCSGEGTIEGLYWVGGLIGETYCCTVRNCSFTGSVLNTAGNARGGLIGRNYGRSVVENCSADANVSGQSFVGGLVGDNEDGTVINSYADANVIADKHYAGGLVGRNWSRYYTAEISNSYSTGTVSSPVGYYIGGLIGYNGYNGTESFVRNCYSFADANGFYAVGGLAGRNHMPGKIMNCYSTGTAQGPYAVGGFSGYSEGDINDCFWDVNTSGISETSLTAIGKTTAQMQQLMTFTDAGWDFVSESANGSEDIWRMCSDGETYPKLYWQFISPDITCPDGVEPNDLEYLTQYWLMSDCLNTPGCPRADFNNDNQIDFQDCSILAQYWLRQ